jgi:hypothetical protein
MLEAFLVPENTVVNVKGDGPTLDVSHAAGRVFLLTLAITNIIEQESLDVGVFGSPDGVTWDPKPTAAFPQKFYCEESPLLLDLTTRPEVKFIRPLGSRPLGPRLGNAHVRILRDPAGSSAGNSSGSRWANTGAVRSEVRGQIAEVKAFEPWFSPLQSDLSPQTSDLSPLYLIHV